jgi:hypothetical protein
MSTVLLILAAFGVLGLVRQAAVAGFGLLRRGVEVYLTSGVEETHARRGDITALREAEGARQLARRARRIAGLRLGLAVALLVIPPLTPWPRLLYAASAILWFLPPRRIG